MYIKFKYNKEQTYLEQFPPGFNPDESFESKTDKGKLSKLRELWGVYNRQQDIKHFKGRVQMSSDTYNKYEFFVFSYLPEDKTLRDRRLRAIEWQQGYILNKFPDAVINYVLQNWREDDDRTKINDRGNILLDSPDGLGISCARNVAIKYLYDSDLDFGIFLDDDSMFTSKSEQYGDNTFKAEDVIKHMFNSDVDLLMPFNPAAAPWRKYYNHYRQYYTDYVWLSRSNTIKGSCFFLKNLKKFKGKEIYMDESLVVWEDHDFAMNMLSQGMKPYKVNNLLLVERNQNNSTLFKDSDDRNEQNAKMVDIVDGRYGIVADDHFSKIRLKKKFYEDNGHTIKELFLRKSID